MSLLLEDMKHKGGKLDGIPTKIKGKMYALFTFYFIF